MGLLRYSDHEVRDLLARAVSIRWPGERLVVLTPCREDGLPAGADPPAVTGTADCDAVLGATGSRLVYQERLTHAVLLRAIAVIMAVMAVASLFTGGGLTTFAVLGVTALGLWSAARITELATMGGISVDFGNIEFIDRLGQRIVGTSRPGTPLRVAVADPSDFQMIVSLVDHHGLAA